MSRYNEVVNILLTGRPQSSREALMKVVERLGEVVAKEATKVIQENNIRNVEAIWDAVKVAPVVEVEMKNLLKQVDRMHVLYVYSRFLNSKAVGPPLVKIAMEELKGG